MAKGKETTTTSEQTRSPWEPAANLLTGSALPLATQWGQTPQSYTGASYIDPTGQQQQATQQMGGYYGPGGQAQTGVVDPTQQAWRQQLDPGAFMNAPGAYAPLDIYSQEVGRNLSENIRPGYAQQAIGAGQYGGYSSERDQADQGATRGAQEAISKYGAGLTGQLYNQGMQAQQGAIAQAPGMLGLGNAPAQGLYGLGAQQRGEQQQQQNLSNQQQAFAQNEPMMRAQQLAGLGGPLAGLGGTSSGTQTQQQEGDLFGTLLGAGMAGAGLMSGNPGMAMGGLFGGGGGGPTSVTGSPQYAPGATMGGYQPFSWYNQGGQMRKGY